MNRLALSPVTKSACQSLMVPSPVPPSHRYHPRPTDLTQMRVNWVSRKTICRFGDRPAYRESLIALSIIKSRSCDSKLISVRLIILRPGVLVVLVGLETKPAEGWTNPASQPILPKEFSNQRSPYRHPVPPVPRPTGTTLDQLISL
jgi:hypothetical protein